MKKIFFPLFAATVLFCVDAARAAKVEQFPYKKITQDAYGINTEEYFWLTGENPETAFNVETPAAHGCRKTYHGELHLLKKGFAGTVHCTLPGELSFWTEERCDKFRQTTRWPDNAVCRKKDADGLFEMKCKEGTVWDAAEKTCAPEKIIITRSDFSGSTTEKTTYSEGSLQYYKTIPASHNCRMSDDDKIDCSISGFHFYSADRCETYKQTHAMTSGQAFCADDGSGFLTMECREGFVRDIRPDIAKNVCGTPFKILEKDLWGEDKDNPALHLDRRYTERPNYDIDKVSRFMRNGRSEKSETGEKCEQADDGNVYIRCTLPTGRFYTRDRCESYVRANNIEAVCEDRNRYSEAVCKSGYRQQSTETSLTCVPENQP